MRGGGMGIVVIGGIGLLVLLAGTASAKPKTPTGPGGPSASDKQAKGEADWAQTQIAIAVAQCKAPESCNIPLLHSTASTLRNHSYQSGAVQAQALKAADDLDAMAQDAADYQAAVAAQTAYNPDMGDQYGNAFTDALGPLGG